MSLALKQAEGSGSERETALVGRAKRKTPPGRGAVFFARFVLFWETVSPVLVVAAAPLFLFAIASMFGVWRNAPLWLHWALLMCSVILTGSLAFVVARTHSAGQPLWPHRTAALNRLEEDGAVAHEALTALEDKPFGDSVGDGASPFWVAHQKRAKSDAAAARLRAPRASIDTIDPYGLRFGAIGLLAIACFAAGEERLIRLVEGFQPSAVAWRDGVTADLWIEPPGYTGKPPVYLLRAEETPIVQAETINTPQASTIVMQAGASAPLMELTTISGDVIRATRDDVATGRQTIVLGESGVLSLRLPSGRGAWPIAVTPDRAPTLAWIDEPARNELGALSLSFNVDDDYGISSAALHIRLDPDQERPLDAPAFEETSLEQTRTVSLDGAAGGPGARAIDIDVEADPWAGLTVIGYLVGEDALGQKARSEKLVFQLPERSFYNPLARAVIEQRQTLAIASDQWRTVKWAFNGLTLGPDNFFSRPTDYLLLRTAMWRVAKKAGVDYEETVEEFWPLALQLEDEALELARRRLEAAKDALRKALENGASDEELERLTEEMRQAMQQFLEALAQSASPSDTASGSASDQTLDLDDLNEMLNSLEDLAKSGAQNAARQALNDLENILNNLQMSSRGQSGQGQQQGQQQGQGSGSGTGSGQPGEGGAGEAGDLIGRQRDLANENFERGQNQGGAPGPNGQQNGEQNGGGAQNLADAQGNLAEDLAALLDQLETNAENGRESDEAAAGRQSLQDALRDMRRAQNALQSDNFEGAGSFMERAIENLRDGAGALAQDEQRQAEARRGQSGNGDEGAMRDPLGRPVGQTFGNGTEVPGLSEADRAREVLQELRRRLSTGDRTEEEIDYLERLLERF